MTSHVSPLTLTGKKVSRGTAPKVPGILQIPLDFSADTDFIVNMNVLEGIRNVQGLGGIQSVKIDNSNNPQNLILAFSNGDNINCPAYCQAIFPVFFDGQLLNFTATCTGGVLVTLTFLNTQETAQIWSSKSVIAGQINVSNSTVFVQPLQSGFIDASAALVTAGVSQLLMAANGLRKLAAVRNPATALSQNIAAPEPVFLNWANPAAVNGLGSWEMLPGESLPEFLITSTDAIYWTATTAGHRLTAKYM